MSDWIEEAPPEGTSGLDGWRKIVAIVCIIAMAVPLVWSATGAIRTQLAADRTAAALAEAPALMAVPDATWRVAVVRCDGSSVTGSGFTTTLRGAPVVVTNRHVVEGAASVTVASLGSAAAQVVEHVDVSTSADVAVLAVQDRRPNDDELVSLPVRESGPQLDDAVVSVGFPAGRASLRSGPVVEVSRGRAVADLRSEGGASGSAILDAQGRVVGQLTGSIDGKAVFTPAAALRQAMRTTQALPACG